MKAWQFFTTLLLACACLGLSVAIVVIAQANQQMQTEIQGRQVDLGNSVLGPQAQQIANTVIQDMGRVAVSNSAMRQLLGKYGYTVQPSPASATGSSTKKSNTLED